MEHLIKNQTEIILNEIQMLNLLQEKYIGNSFEIDVLLNQSLVKINTAVSKLVCKQVDLLGKEKKQ